MTGKRALREIAGLHGTSREGPIVSKMSSATEGAQSRELPMTPRSPVSDQVVLEKQPGQSPPLFSKKPLDKSGPAAIAATQRRLPRFLEGAGPVGHGVEGRKIYGKKALDHFGK